MVEAILPGQDFTKRRAQAGQCCVEIGSRSRRMAINQPTLCKQEPIATVSFNAPVQARQAP